MNDLLANRSMDALRVAATWLPFLSLLLILGMIFDVGEAQSQVPTGSTGRCTGCRVHLQKLLELGNENGDGAFPQEIVALTTDSQNRYWAVFPHSVHVYDAGGKFLRSVGRQGAGPGEFVDASRAIVLPGDSVAILDRAASRITVVDREFRVARTVQLPRSLLWDIAVVEWPKTVVVNGLISTPLEFGWPLHVLDLSGSEASVTRSFGDNEGEYRAGGAASLFEHLTVATDKRLWSTKLGQVSVRSWSAAGERETSLVMRPAWFPTPSNVYSLGSTDESPPPKMAGIREGPNGRIWIFAHIPREGWQSVWTEFSKRLAQNSASEVALSLLPSPHELYRTAVALVDVERGELIAETTNDMLFLAPLSGDRIASRIPGDNGRSTLVIFRLLLTKGSDGADRS